MLVLLLLISGIREMRLLARLAMAGMDLARSFSKRDRGRRNGKILLGLVS
jgi:hypothetical protein